MKEFDYSKGYWNPYVAGIALGLVLLLTYYVMGTGLGASGAVARTSAAIAHTVVPEAVEKNAYFSEFYKTDGRSVFVNWIVFEVIGLLLGGLVAAATAGRIKPEIGKGPTASAGLRLSMALIGGIIAGIGTRFAMGCTSGQALSGGAVMAVGSWVFMMMVFGVAFSVAYFFRRQWS